MDFATEQLVVATQKQLLNVWFLLYLTRGHTREKAARDSWHHANDYLREAGFSEDQTKRYLMSEDSWTRMMLIEIEGTEL